MVEIKQILRKVWSHWFTKIIVNILVLGGFITALGHVGGGVFAYILSVIGFSIVIYLFKREYINERIMFAIRSVEISIFGKPLDKDFWEIGEWKARKQSKKSRKK